MKCPKCQSMNREGVKFCEDCGAPMELQCPSCGALIPPGKRFCGECGQKLAELPSPLDTSRPASYTPKHLADQILTTRSALEGERKLVTVLFADVAHFTSLSEKLDPEEVHQILDGCFQILMEKIHQYEGTINQFTGDGVMALFGVPLAHEDHAQRACHAALAIQRALADYKEKVQKQYGIDFSMRIGLNSGPVVVGKIGDDLRMDYTAIGDTTNLASRMQRLAQPGTISVSHHTHRLAQDFFLFRPLGPIPVKGKEEPQEAFQLLQPSEVETRIEAAVARGLTRFVGRKNSMAALLEAWEKVLSGSGQVVGIVGEAGVGKSRLLLEMRKRLPAEEFTYLEGRCLHYGGSVAYLPILDLLRSYFGIREGDREHLLKRKLRDKISCLDQKLLSSLACFQDVLSLQGEDEAYLRLEPNQRRERIFEAIRDLFLRESEDQPLLLAIEDLHWIDKTSQEFLDYLIGWLAHSPILLLLLHRPEYTPPWGSMSYYNRIGLDQLSLPSSAELVAALLEGGEVAPELKDLILYRAAGNPLFMEEFTHTLIENGSIQKQDHRYILSKKPSEIQVPDTIQGIIAARMDRLEENLKRTLQVAAVIGRDFAFRILQVILDMQEELKGHLLNLQGLEFIYEKSLFPELEYLFKHALTQEVAYNSLLLKRRKEIHEKIGQAIEQLYAERLEEFYEALAYHFEMAGVPGKAVKYLRLAGERAVRLSANEEAIAYLNRAIELLQTLPESTARNEQELALQMALNPPLMAARGWAAPEIGRAAARTLELCQKMGEHPQTFTALHLLRSYHLVRGEHRRVLELAEQMFDLAQRTRDPLQMMTAQKALGSCLYWVGEFHRSRVHFEQAIASYDPHQHRGVVFIHGYDERIDALSHQAWVLWFLGYPDQALQHCLEAVGLARELDHPFSLAHALGDGGNLHLLCREPQAVQRNAEELMRLSTEGGFLLFEAWATFLVGYSRAQQGEVEEGIAQMHQGHTGWRSRGTGLGDSLYLLTLAEAYEMSGQAEKGLALIKEALDVVERTGERVWEAEVHRVKGELLQSSGDLEEAEASFRRAIAVARGQEAKSWELRATVSLSRLLQKEGRSEEARSLLSEIYAWFTEGFDTPDLQEARALLKELGSKGTQGPRGQVKRKKKPQEA